LAPFWAARLIMPCFDITVLRPPTLPKGRRFETEKDVDAASRRLIDRLARALDPKLGEIAASLTDCRPARARCGAPLCPRCARIYRIWLTGQLLTAVAHPRFTRHRILTLYLGTFPSGSLDQANLARARDQLRKRLTRCGFAGAVAIGGLEVSFRSDTDDWRLHAHLLVLNARPRAIRRLKFQLGASNCRVQRLRDPPRQISYLQKFSTGHRPRTQTGQRRSRMYPLPIAQLRELALWMDQYGFTDFLFVYGARRRGSTIRVISRVRHAQRRQRK